MTTGLARARDPSSPLTEELQTRLIEALKTGLMPRYVALLCSVAPNTMYEWLDAGARRDALQPYRGFCVAWVRAEAILMQERLAIAMAGGYGAREAWLYLERRWPKVWGKDADPPFEPLRPQVTNAEEQEQMEAILADPAAFGLLELFAKHNRLTPEERAQIAVPPQPTE